MMIGYARVSSDEQNPNLQRDALAAAGCSVIYEDRITGTTFTRGEFDRALAALQPGDEFVVWKVDRFGRDMMDTLRMKKIAGIAETAGAKLRDRTRSLRHHLLNIARAARSKSQPNQEKPTEIYGKLLTATGRVVGQAKRFSREIAGGVKRAADPRRQLRLVALRQQLEQMLPRIGQVMRQTHARIFAGDTHAEGRIVSIFEPSTEVIRKGKAGKPTEFGKMVKL